MNPVLLCIAGPNGAGKTTVTARLREERWSEGVEYLNPDEIARDRFGTKDPRINAARVAGRIIAGGHSVPIEKIVSRHVRSMANLAAVIRLSDRVSKSIRTSWTRARLETFFQSASSTRIGA